jgi:hypothetical protein
MSVQHGRLSMSGKGLVGRNVEPIPFRFAPADEILLEVAWMACCVLAAGSQRANDVQAFADFVKTIAYGVRRCPSEECGDCGP